MVITMDIIGVPKDIPEGLKAWVVSTYNEMQKIKEENYHLRRQLYGKRAEKFYEIQEFIPEEGTLFNDVEALADQPDSSNQEEESSKSPADEESDKKSPKPKKTGGKKPLPKNLHREVKTHDIPEKDKVCSCGGDMAHIGDDVVEKLSIVPAHAKVIEHRYKKYACPCCQHNVQKAKAEPSFLTGAMVETNVVASVITAKFAMAVPLYRQEDSFSQIGVTIPRATMARWVMSAAGALEPVVEALKAYILSQPVAHCDETPVQVIKSTGKKAPASQNYMWVLCSYLDAKAATVFQYNPSRSGACAQEILKSFYGGILQVDGYSGYNTACHNLSITRVGCWAHVRRKFHTAHQDGAKSGKALAEEFLKEIKKLFAIEAKIQDQTPEKRVMIRKKESQPIITTIRNLIDTYAPKALPSSKIGKAIGYLSNEWPHLLHFLENGHVALSNNRVENAIRPFAIGRKNWIFQNTARGAHASAILYSLVTSAKSHGVAIHEYIEDLLNKMPYLPDDPHDRQAFVEALLPWNWQGMKKDPPGPPKSS